MIYITLPWDYKLKSGETLWNVQCYAYYNGAATVKENQKTWVSLEGQIDQERFDEVSMLLAIQHSEAVWWRNACLLYFQTFSKRPLPTSLEKPAHTLEYYKIFPHRMPRASAKILI